MLAIKNIFTAPRAPTLPFPYLQEYTLGRITELILRQSHDCGYFYSIRKYLVISLLLKYVPHLRVTRSFSLPNTQALSKHYPRHPFKYLHNYLALSFNIDTRAIILSNHYRFLNNVVNFEFINHLCHSNLPVYEEIIEGNRYSIELSYPKNEEGELCLILSVNTSQLFTLSFTIAPGKSLNVSDDQVIFIGRLQGVAKQKEAIKEASRAFHDINPATLLLSAVRGIANALNISNIIGVSAQNQVCQGRTASVASFKAAYDDFYISVGAKILDDKFYYLPVTPDEKPLSSIKNNHRSRVKRKRLIKNKIIEQTSALFRTKYLSS